MALFASSSKPTHFHRHHSQRFMGSKLSCIHPTSLSREHHPTSPAPARLVAVDGSLKEFPASSPVSVSDVLGANAASFVCNSDALYFNQEPPALGAGELLRPGQIYFLLPAAMLGRPLSSTDMAALAVRASIALAARRPRRGRGRAKKVRVMPVHEDGDAAVNEKLNASTLGQFATPLSPARSAKKLRSPPKRALSTIEEDA